MNQTNTHVPKIAVAKAKRAATPQVGSRHKQQRKQNAKLGRGDRCTGCGRNKFVAAQLLHDQPRHTHSYSCTQNCQKPGQPGDEEDPHLLRISIKKICRHNIDDSYK